MAFALVVNGSIIEVRGVLPETARRLDNDAWVMSLAYANADLRAACGWVEIVEVAAPVVQASEIADQSVTLVNGTPTRTWTVRNKTADELNIDAENTGRTTLKAKAVTALAANATYLAIVSPTNAQVVAQVRALTKEVNALIRLADGFALLRDTSDT